VIVGRDLDAEGPADTQGVAELLGLAQLNTASALSASIPGDAPFCGQSWPGGCKL
jgi:hypothetical protein